MKNQKEDFKKVLSSIQLWFMLVIGIVAYSAPFYLFLLTLVVVFCLLSFFVTGFLVNVFSIVVIAFLCFHGWKGLNHVLEDYVFDPVLRSLFAFLINIILFRLLLIIFF
jgi:succinate dehydrogenase hydrophobic anchor subunit